MLANEVAAWTTLRNETGAMINWMFRVDDAREKLGKAYPDVAAMRLAKAA